MYVNLNTIRLVTGKKRPRDNDALSEHGAPPLKKRRKNKGVSVQFDCNLTATGDKFEFIFTYNIC